MTSQHWAFRVADDLIQRFPSRMITCASGISPSGIVHAGNLREIMTAEFVYRALKNRGVDTRFLFSWDDFDRLRKVPANMPASLGESVGKPYSEVPDPYGEYSSYAERFEKIFESAMEKLGVQPEFIRQYGMYKSGAYDENIRFALQNRSRFGQVIARNMTQGMTPQELDEYFPVSVYSRFTGKDTTKILAYDGENKLTYLCEETGKQDTIDFTKDHQVKLAWKIDWPMRWRHENVDFEPGGPDHASPLGSYHVSSQIARELFDIEPPQFLEYQFIRIKGMSQKMSSSKGNVFSPAELLEVYSPMMVRWLYCRSLPNVPIDIAFDIDVIRAHEEFDRRVLDFVSGNLEQQIQQEIFLSMINEGTKLQRNPISFRQIAGMGDATDFNKQRIHELLALAGSQFDVEGVDDRLERSHKWMDQYFPEGRSKLVGAPNTDYYRALPTDQQQQIAAFREIVARADLSSIESLESALYAIPKRPEMSDPEKKLAQRTFFRNVYQLLFGKDQGPRLPTYVWAGPREKLKQLLGFDIKDD